MCIIESRVETSLDDFLAIELFSYHGVFCRKMCPM